MAYNATGGNCANGKCECKGCRKSKRVFNKRRAKQHIIKATTQQTGFDNAVDAITYQSWPKSVYGGLVDLTEKPDMQVYLNCCGG
mgnify:CR=1 FL=1